MKLNTSVKIGDMVIIKRQTKAYPISSINALRTKVIIHEFLGDFDVSNLDFVDNESPGFSDEEVKAMEEGAWAVWQGATG